MVKDTGHVSQLTLDDIPIFANYKLTFPLTQQSKTWSIPSVYEFKILKFILLGTSAGIAQFIALLAWVAKVLHKIAVFIQISEMQSHTF